MICFHSSEAYRPCDIIFASKQTTVKDRNWSSLRPHEVDTWVILVKSHIKLDVEIEMNYHFFSILALFIVCTMFRLLFRLTGKCPHRDLVGVTLDSLGVLLSTNTKFRIRNRPELIMNIFVLFLSTLTSKLITAILFRYMLAIEIDVGVDTLNELNEMQMPIYISDEMRMTMDEWSSDIP